MLSWLWPSVCAGCEIEGRGRLCADCAPGAVHRVGVDIPFVRGVFATAGYPSPVGSAIRKAKYGGKRPLGLDVAASAASALAPALRRPVPMQIVPAPSPWDRRMERGFSLPDLLAEALSARTGWRVSRELSARRGEHQAGLDRAARRKNLAGRVRSDRAIHGDVLLVDDVLTTGATAEACARELIGSGASSVWLAVVCAVRPNSEADVKNL